MKCLLCGKECLKIGMHLKKHGICSKEYYDKFFGSIKENDGKCLLCGKDTKFLNVYLGYSKHCSSKCSNSDQSVILKKIFTCRNNFSVDYPGQSSTVKDRIKNSCRKNLGVDNPAKSNIVKVKMKKTCKDRFGVEYSSQCSNIKARKRKKFLERFLKIIHSNLDELSLKMLDEKEYTDSYTDFNILCLKCGNIFKTSYTAIQQGYGRCPNCYPKNKSNAETDILNFIKSLNFSFKELVENSRKIIPPYELDIYIPSKKIAIEYNGLYWHSEKILKDKMYHMNKLNKCEDNNIRLIQIFEDEWLSKQDIVKSKLKQILNISNRIRIHARKCNIKPISNTIKNEFLNKYHLQGQDTSSIRLGAFYKDQLISVMTFNRGSISKGSKLLPKHWELNRFCSNSNYHIPGIASKLLSFFKKNYEWEQIYSYADRRWSSGNLYKVLGFELKHNTKPNYWYIKNCLRIHRYNLRKKLDEPKDVPEWVLRINEGYNRIWDCGNIKFILNKRYF